MARSAVNGGAAVGAVEDGSAGAAAEARAQIERAGGLSLLEDVTVAATSTGTEVTVTVEGTAITFVPLLPSLKVKETTTAAVERFTVP